jgi:hypothetical protein
MPEYAEIPLAGSESVSAECPICTFPNTENTEPNRARERIDIALPSAIKSRTLRTMSARQPPDILKPEPSLATLRRLQAVPTLIWSKTDMLARIAEEA